MITKSDLTELGFNSLTDLYDYMLEIYPAQYREFDSLVNRLNKPQRADFSDVISLSDHPDKYEMFELLFYEKLEL